ncbi:MAG: hypothetical protein N2Z63_02820 [Thiobacillaceae bacterium]|nr:hypothetical protein [Thiobacillaceae bacterium]MDW8324716.1 hypothetical protein [Burkholderiales bacterium]
MDEDIDRLAIVKGCELAQEIAHKRLRRRLSDYGGSPLMRQNGCGG